MSILTVTPLHLTVELFSHVALYRCSVPKSHSSSSPCHVKHLFQTICSISTINSNQTVMLCCSQNEIIAALVHKMRELEKGSAKKCFSKHVWERLTAPKDQETEITHTIIVPARKRCNPFKIHIHKHLDSHTSTSHLGARVMNMNSFLVTIRAPSLNEPGYVKVGP